MKHTLVKVMPGLTRADSRCLVKAPNGEYAVWTLYRWALYHLNGVLVCDRTVIVPDSRADAYIDTMRGVNWKS